MPFDQRVEAEQEFKKSQPKLSPEDQVQAAQTAIKNESRRGQDLAKQMSRADRGWIESRGLAVPGFDNKIHAGGTLVYLTKDETKTLEKYTLEEYNSTMKEIRLEFPSMEKEQKELYFDAIMRGARDRARGRLMEKINR